MAMVDSWGRIFSRESSRDYKPVPTREPSGFHTYTRSSEPAISFGNNLARASEPGLGLLNTRPSRRPGRRSGDILDYSRLWTPATDTSRMSLASPGDPMEMQHGPTRHTVHMGALGARVSQFPMMIHSPDQEAAPASIVKSTAEEVVVDDPTSFWSFVEKWWFQSISAVVIISNVVTTIVEMDKPRTKDMFFISDQILLGFYIVELCSRATYFKNMFLFGPPKFVCWNVLDIVVVVAGVLDQWLMPLLPVAQNVILSTILKTLRLLRLLRVFKIVRVFLDVDLSWTEAPAFQSFIGLVILINSLLMGMEIDVPWHGWFYFEQVLLSIYVFELGVRLKNFGEMFFWWDNNDIIWNILDFIIVTTSVLDSWIIPLCVLIFSQVSGSEAAQDKKENRMSFGKVMLLMRMLRLMRILRLAKLVKSVRPLFILVTGVMAALQGVVWVLVLTMITLYAMGILATNLIGHKMAFPPGTTVPDEILLPFNSVPNSMFTLFRVMSGAASDSEQTAIDDLMDNVPSIKLGFVFYMITSSWTLLSILTAVVSDNMISTTSQQEEEHRIATAEEDRFIHVRRLKQLFNSIDVTGDGQVEHEEIEAFLSDRKNALLTAKHCRVPVRDVREVLQTVSEACEGSTISFEAFVDHLADVSNPVSEKSVMKLEARLSNLSNLQSESFEKLSDMLKKQETSNNTVVSNLEKVTEACLKRVQKDTEFMCKCQLKEVERSMRGMAETTEACLSEMQQKSQGLFESMTEQMLSKIGVDKFSEMLELQLFRMQHELLCSMRGQVQDSSSMQNPLIVDGVRGSLEATLKPAAVIENQIKKEGQSVTVNENQTDVRASSASVELTAPRMEGQVFATQECALGLQQSIQCMLSKTESILEKMGEVVDEGLPALAVDKVSNKVESQLRMIMRQELCMCNGQQTSGEAAQMKEYQGATATSSSSKEGDLLEKSLQQGPSAPPVSKFSDTLESALGMLRQELLFCLERLAAPFEHLMKLEQKTEAALTKIKGSLEYAVDQQGFSALAVEHFSETLERELRTMRQELLHSLGGHNVHS